MKTIRNPLILATALVAALALSACGKGNEPATSVPAEPPPSATALAPPMAPLPTTPPSSSSTAAMPMGGSTAAVGFSSVEIGSSVDANNKVSSSGTSFTPRDNIYAAVETIGNGHATLAAKWTYQDGQAVHEDSKVLDTMGPQSTVFMISKPSGFPAGNYKVDISLDGKSVASKDFTVKK